MTKTIPGLNEEQTHDFMLAISTMSDEWTKDKYLVFILGEHFQIDESQGLVALVDDDMESICATLSDVVDTVQTCSKSFTTYEKDDYKLNIWQTSIRADYDSDSEDSVFFELTKPNQAHPVTFEFSYPYSSWSGPNFAEASILPVMRTPEGNHVSGEYTEEAMQAQIDLMEQKLADYRALKETYFGAN